MKVVELDSLMGTPREVWCPKQAFVSFRFLLESDGMGFGLHKTVIPAGRPQRWHYKSHLEACYCVSGLGILTSENTGQRYTIKPDSCYVLDDHDPHTFHAIEDTVLISVFNPPCVGGEVHQDDGSYAKGK